ncbi:UNVERIFIED_CONTAM: hypothetical protein RMT77_007661 [Armadillidium vulgare]
MQEGEDMRENLRKFFVAVDKFGKMEVNINSNLLVIMLIYSLPANSENFRCSIEPRDELPNPEALSFKIFEESDARKSRREIPQNAILSAKQKRNIKYCKAAKFTQDKNQKNEEEPFN